ncbi:MAG TPA: hypothetical protein G4N92_09390 [Anaerolineae bacterium]|nr:hypothetical protein [Anaerolineae bacterium]
MLDITEKQPVCVGQPQEEKHAGEESYPDELTIVQGELRKDTLWEGEVLVVDNIFVPEGITLTILPGTHVRFQHYRGYKEPWKRLGLDVFGTILAVGTPDAPIYFSTDARDPQNGDWRMIHVHDSQDSIFEFCVVEFAQQGINFWGGLAHISH